MAKVSKVLFALAILGVLHTGTLAKPIDDMDEMKKIVGDGLKQINEISAAFEESSLKASAILGNTTMQLKEVINEFLNEARDQLDNGSGLLDEKLKEHTGFDLSEHTCGLVSFRNAAMKTFEITQTCAMGELEKTSNNIQHLLTEIANIAELTRNPLEKVNECLKMTNATVKKVKACAEENVQKAKLAVTSLQSAFQGVRGVAEIARFKTMLVACLTKESMTTIAGKSTAIYSCVEEKIPAIKGAIALAKNGRKEITNYVTAEAEKRIADLQKDVSVLSEQVTQELLASFGNVKSQITDALNNAVSAAGEKIGEKMNEVKGKIGETVNNAVSSAGEKLGETVNAAGEKIGEKMNEVKGKIGETVNNAVSSAGEKIGETVNAAGEKIGEKMNEVKGKIGETVNNAVSSAGEKIGETVNAAGEKIGEKMNEVKGKIGETVNNAVSSAGEKIGETVNAAGQRVGDAMSAAKSAAEEKAKQLAKELEEKLQAAKKGFWGYIG